MNCKTYKRETAIVLLATFWGLVGFVAWQLRGNDVVLMQLVETTVLPVFAFASLAFGLDWKSKQAKGGEE